MAVVLVVVSIVSRVAYRSKLNRFGETFKPRSRCNRCASPPRLTDRPAPRRGGAAAELALLLPVLSFILIVAIDFCRLFYAYNVITNCARNGALWASDPLC